MSSLRRYLLTLNLFEAQVQTETESEYQRQTNVIATRTYLITLFVILLANALYMTLILQTTVVTVENPTQPQYESLPDPRCPCTRTSIPFGEFVFSAPLYHQICSSQFVSDRWISALYFGTNSTRYLAIDIRAAGFAQFRGIASFCRLSKINVLQSLSRFGSSSFFSYQVFPASVVGLQVEAFVNRFQLATPNTFRSQVHLISTMIISERLLNGQETSASSVLRSDSGRFEGEIELNSFHQKDGTLCQCERSLTCDWPCGIYNELDIHTQGYNNNLTSTMIIPGLSSGCMPVDACLQSSLECFYNQTCVNAMTAYMSVFGDINFTALNASTMSRFHLNSTIESMVAQLMVENWGTSVSYEKYYKQCAPASCTYFSNNRRDIRNALMTLIGLIGGLCAGLRVVVPLVVQFIQKRLAAAETIPPHILPVNRLHQAKVWMKRFLLELNLFTKNSISDRHVRQQQIATRAYIALVSFAFAILALYSSLNSEIYQEVVNNPTLAQFSLLRSQYPTSLQCPCSSISAEYSAFLTVEPHYHQICSSNFISTSWIAYTNEGIRNNEFYDPEDYRQNAGSLFQLLATFCQQAQQTINDALQLFLKEHFVTSDVISEDLFKAQTNKFIEDWQFNTMNSFFRPLQLIRNVQQGNQIMTPTYNFNLGFISDFGFVSVTSKEYEIIANETSPDSTFCLCSISTFCRKLMPIRDLNISTGLYQFRLYVPNFYIGCFRIEAMFMSTLECFYSETCINTLASFMLPNAHNVTWVPLNDSQNPANEMLESIITRLFVDDWSNRTSFSDYYIVCAPQSCTYDIMRRRTLIPLITLIISIFGGLTTGLKILFSILLHILGKVRAERNLKNQLTAIRLWFRSINNQEYLSNRLKIVFLVVTLSALYFTSAITLIPQTEHVLKPPLGTYEQLLLRFPHTLQCPCSQVSVKYGSFLNLSSARRHQVCTSDFVSDRWIATLYLSYDHLGSSQSKFSNAAIGFFQLVASLCELTEQIVSDSLSQLAGTYLFQYHVLSRAEFNRQVQLMVEQFQLNPSDSFLITLELIREMMSTNSLMTLFRTNWRFTDVIGIPYDGQKIQTEPVSYGTCDCGLSAQCVELAKTEDNNPLPGLFVGCYPLESLLKSTLECFYNGSCLEELQLMNTSFTQLDNSLLRQFEENSTLEFLLSRLMVDGWSSNVSYENYYAQCAPSSCWYSYFEHRPAVEVITSLLALYGGLVVITNVVVSMLLALWRKVIQQRPRQIQTTVTLFIFT